MSRHLVARCLAFVAATFALACGDATPTEPITLVASDVKQLYQELETTFSHAELSRRPAGLQRTAPPRGLSLDALGTVAVTVNCTSGGSANFTGTDNSTPSTPAYDVSVTFNKCQTDHFELSGNFHQTITTSAVITGTQIATIGTGDITVKVLSSGTAGTCHIDFNITVTNAISATGTFCGAEVQGTLVN